MLQRVGSVVAAMSSRNSVMRSETTDSLFVRRNRFLFRERAFRVPAPEAWNQLPRDVHCVDNTNTFKKKLKTSPKN